MKIVPKIIRRRKPRFCRLRNLSRIVLSRRHRRKISNKTTMKSCYKDGNRTVNWALNSLIIRTQMTFWCRRMKLNWIKRSQSMRRVIIGSLERLRVGLRVYGWTSSTHSKTANCEPISSKHSKLARKKVSNTAWPKIIGITQFSC